MARSLVGTHPDVGPHLDASAQRAKLLEAMVQAVAEKGYAAATVADAVKGARVSRGTFYELFESKEQCFAAAYALGLDVLEERIADAVKDATGWRDEMRRGLRAYLHTLDDEPRFAAVYLREAHHVADAREAGRRRFAGRYRKTFEKSGGPVPPDDALYVLACGVHELACSRLRAGKPVIDLEDTLVGCALRLATDEETPWT